MRFKKIIKLDEHISVIVHELRVCDARNLIGRFKEIKDQDINVLLTERFDEFAGLLSDCLEITGDKTLNDLSFSEIAEIKDGLIEVNAAFLDLVGLAGLDGPLTTGLTSSTEPVPGSSSTDMST